MKEILLKLWQWPQNLLGKLLTKEYAVVTVIGGIRIYYKEDMFVSSLSLGDYILFDTKYFNTVHWKEILHEQGHQEQSKKIGPFYLLIILISVIEIGWDRLFHDKWSIQKREEWYHKLPWEAWADRLGGLNE